jgi:peptidoglycan/LPS O-acetylase OafA/YrhL
MGTFGLILLYIGFGSLMLVSLRENIRNKNSLIEKAITMLAAIGFYSYSIYLWHMPMKDWGLRMIRYVLKRFDSQAILSIYSNLEWLIYIVGSVILGIIVARFIEIPALKLRDRIFPSLSKPLLVISDVEVEKQEVIV